MKKYFIFYPLFLCVFGAVAQSVELLPDTRTNLSLPQFSYQQILNIQNPSKGSLVYDSTARCVRMYNGLSWDCLHRNATNTPEFTAAWKPGGDNYISAIDYAVDNAGNIYIAGNAYGPVVFGYDLFINVVNNVSFFIVKYSPQGKALWLRNSVSYGYGSLTHIKIGTDAKLYMAATFNEQTTFGSYSSPNNNSQNVLVGKMDLDGNFEWTNTIYGGATAMNVAALSLDSQNNVYLSGHAIWPLTFSNSAEILAHEPNSLDNGVYIKYASNGSYVWSKKLFSTETFQISDLQIDTNGEIYMGASFTGSTTLAGTTINSAGEFDILLMKADNAGNILWARREGGAIREYYPKLALVNGNIFVVGSLRTPSNIGGVNLTSNLPPELGSPMEVFYGIYNPTSQTWNYVKKTDNGGVTSVIKLNTDSRGNFYTSGGFTSTLNFGNKTITNATHGNAFYVKGNMQTGDILHLNGFSSLSGGEHGIKYGLYKNNKNVLVGNFFSETNIGDFKLRNGTNYGFFIGLVEE